MVKEVRMGKRIMGSERMGGRRVGEGRRRGGCFVGGRVGGGRVCLSMWVARRTYDCVFRLRYL